MEELKRLLKRHGGARVLRSSPGNRRRGRRYYHPLHASFEGHSAGSVTFERRVRFSPTFPHPDHFVIYITIPVHNEERTIGVLLWKIRKVMAEFGRDYRILVLDDASSDGTADALSRYRKHLPLTVTRSDERLGKGRATEQLLRQAARHTDYPKRDMAVTLQGDFTEDPGALVDMVKSIEGGADLVVGTLDRSSVPRSVRWAHTGAGLVLGGVARSAPVSDPLSSLRAYRLIVVRKALREGENDDGLLTSDGWAANLELLVRTAPHARRVDEMPYRMRAGPRSRASRFEPWKELRGLVSLRGLSWSAVVMVALLG